MMAHVRVFRQPSKSGGPNGRYTRALNKLKNTPDLKEAFELMVSLCNVEDDDPAGEESLSIVMQQSISNIHVNIPNNKPV